jgi:hypothetical protein
MLCHLENKIMEQPKEGTFSGKGPAPSSGSIVSDKESDDGDENHEGHTAATENKSR